MYAIANIIYGVPLEDANGDRDETLEEMVEMEPKGVLAYYSGSAHIKPAAFGVDLGSIDECNSVTELSELKLIPTPEQVQEYKDNYEALDDEQKQALVQCGEPRVFFLWSTS